MTKLADLPRTTQVKAIEHYTVRARNFAQLDQCATNARETGNWKLCVKVIHDRNMTMLGKPGYGPAVYKKGWHIVIVRDEFVAFKSGKEIHVRELCKRGYRFVPTSKRGKNV